MIITFVIVAGGSWSSQGLPTQKVPVKANITVKAMERTCWADGFSFLLKFKLNGGPDY